ncbi:MAG TPA: T9SS type A sorting domain-containing protein [Bacteroidia bacterium]|jgi:sugar lactone lactonase YvrE|nr:T9SS type A sorting domain-containing protein [Bacteroidia bacterium]
MKKLITIIAFTFCINANAQIITTVAGNGTAGYNGDGGQATAAELYHTVAVAFDTKGNMYIVDQKNVIRKVNTSGIITTIAGNGTAGYSGDGGPATAATFNEPISIAIDSLGNIYVSDDQNNAIRMINTMGIISTIAGNGTAGYIGDGGQATAAEINSPNGIAFDAFGNLFIADGNNNRIRMINTAGIITTIAGNGTGTGNASCTTCYGGDGGQATAAELNNPCAIVFDAKGNMYIADQNNNRIRMVNTAGIINTIAGNGTYGYSGDGGPATSANLRWPVDVKCDTAGNIFICDIVNERIRKVNSLGIISTIAGIGYLNPNTGGGGFGGDGGQATAALLNLPLGICLDASGNLYIADQENNRIRKVTNVTTVGIEQSVSTSELNINIYPNPNNGLFVIEPSETEKQTMRLYDITGNLVLVQVINGKTNIDASNLAEGVYNISITSTEGVTNKRLIIVK